MKLQQEFNRKHPAVPLPFDKSLAQPPRLLDIFIPESDELNTGAMYLSF
jgi:hypothetical protein